MSKNLILLLLTIFTLSCCDKDDDKTAIEQLPPATTIGANKVGCLVNGAVFLPRGSNPFGSPIVTCSYQYVNNAFEFGLGFTNNFNGLRGISILSNKLEFIQGNTYLIKQELSSNSVYSYFNVGLIYYGTNIINNGELKIIKLDQTNAIISGTFWFDAVNSNGTIVQIREGRFDMQYSQ